MQALSSINMWPFSKQKRVVKEDASKRTRVYLDHAAATPVREEVLAAMQPYFCDLYGNPSAIHQEGVAARAALEDARLRIARTLAVRLDEVTFTSGGTEGNNIAITGHVRSLHTRGVAYEDMEIIALATEHPSILRVLEEVAERGVTVTYLPVNEDGLLNSAALQAALTPKTRLVTVAYANSEVGVVQDLTKIGRMLAQYERDTGVAVALHTDACQAPLWLPCSLEALRVDAMTLDAGKFGGPKGVGILVHRPRMQLAPVLYGGSQERGLRPGTENVPLVVGMATALTLAQASWQSRQDKVIAVRDRGIKLLSDIPGVVLNGSTTARVANNINISVRGIDTEFTVVVLDAAGIACATKSACAGAGSGSSSVVLAMTGDEARAAATMRLTLGEETTDDDVDRVAEVLAGHIAQMRPFTHE